MRRIQFLLTMALMSVCVMAQVQTYTVDGVNYQPVLEVNVIEGIKFSGDVVIPDAVNIDGKSYWVTGINRGALASREISSVHLGSHVRVISPYAIAGAFNRIKIPANVMVIDPLSFFGSPNLEYIEVDDGSNYFTEDEGVLYNKDMTKLIIYPIKKNSSKYVIPDGVKYISSYAFWETEVAALDIPSTVLYVGGFDSAPNLSTLIVRATTPPTLIINNVSSKTFRECMLYVPNECIEDYKNNQFWGKFQNIKGIDELSAVETVRMNTVPAAGIYGLDGTLRSEFQSGINIIVEDNGESKKVLKRSHK